MMSDYEGTARLSNKRVLDPNGLAPKYPSRYIVDTTCSECGHEVVLAFAGWCGIVCRGCGRMLRRGQYVKRNVLFALAEVGE